jgi:hypothetical protein
MVREPGEIRRDVRGSQDSRSHSEGDTERRKGDRIWNCPGKDGSSVSSRSPLILTIRSL